MHEPPGCTALVPRSRVAALSRRALLGGFAAGAAGLALSGCSRSTALAASAASDGRLEDQLNVYSWGDYDDPVNITRFQRARGVTVQLDGYGSNEELIAKLGATRGTSGYDIVVPTGSYIPLMAQNGLLEPLDHGRLPGMANIDPAYLDQSWDRGNRYSVCKDFGTTGFAYDTDVIQRDLTSWADFIDAATKEAKGDTAVLEDPWEVCCIWFAANDVDPNTTDAAALDACEQFLVDTLAPTIKAFNSTAAQTGIPQKTFSLIQAFNGDVRLAYLAMDEPPKNWRFVYPTPTANLWMDTWTIAKGTQHPDAAYAFIDYMLQPDVSYREVDYIGYSTGLTGIQERAVEEGFELPELVFLTSEVVDRLTPSRLTSATERLNRIINRMMAKASA